MNKNNINVVNQKLIKGDKNKSLQNKSLQKYKYI